MEKEYDEEYELTEYVWRNYGKDISPLEWNVVFAAHGKLIASAMTDEIKRMASGINIRNYRDEVRARLIREKKNIQIIRCEKCNKILRTPKAQQCLWCGFDWHFRA